MPVRLRNPGSRCGLPRQSASACIPHQVASSRDPVARQFAPCTAQDQSPCPLACFGNVPVGDDDVADPFGGQGGCRGIKLRAILVHEPSGSHLDHDAVPIGKRDQVVRHVLTRLAKTFGVSEQAMSIRLLQLRLVTPIVGTA